MINLEPHIDEGFAKLEAQCSMIYWWPLVVNIDVPKPETTMLMIEDPMFSYGLCDGDPQAVKAFKRLAERTIEAATPLGYPLFLRTDKVSGKHSFKRTCFVPSEEDLPRHISSVLEEHMLALDEPAQAIVLRQFIPLEYRFRAFYGELPIAKERRYFVRDGQVDGNYSYWPEDAIKFQHFDQEGPENWRGMLAELNIETDDEIALLTDYATKLAVSLPGYWSVDFALGQDGIWYFIDAARGERSWRPERLATKRRLSEISCV